MKRSPLNLRLLAVLLLASLAALLLATADTKPPRAAAPATAWEVSGLWTETCGCMPTCPCWFGKRPTHDHCENIQVFRIDKGHYGAVSLDHLIVVLAWVSPPGPKSMDQTAAHTKILAYYLDQSTTTAQREAIAKIWNDSIMTGIHAAQGGVKIVSFQNVDIQPDHATISIPGILTFDVHRWKDHPVKIDDPVRTGFQQGSSKDFRYADYGVRVHYSARHAFFAAFHAHS
jgi:hypothetical protein